MKKLIKFFPILIIAALAIWLFQRTQLLDQPANEWADFINSPIHELPISDQDAMTASEEAPIQMLIFSDFECPACSDLALMSKQWLQRFDGKINLIFKHYPLSSACNPEMEYDMHPNACAAAKASQAALRQGKFWELHDLFFDQSFTAEDFPLLAAEAGLDLDQFLKDLSDPAIEEKVQLDIELANELKIMGTPSIFINGRQVDNPYPEKIEAIIEQLLVPGV